MALTPAAAVQVQQEHNNVPSPREGREGGHAVLAYAPTAEQLFDAALERGDVRRCLALLQPMAMADNALRPAPPPRLSERQHTSLVATCFARGLPGLALQYVALLPPDARSYALVLRHALRQRDVDVPFVYRVLGARMAAGILPDAHSQSALIAALGKAGRRAEALRVFDECWEEVGSCRTVAVCNAAVNVLADAGDWDGAQRVLSMMQQAGLSPDIITINSLIKAAGAAGLMAEVVRLHASLRAQGSGAPAPTPITFTQLFKASATNQHPDASWLFTVRCPGRLEDSALHAPHSLWGTSM